MDNSFLIIKYTRKAWNRLIIFIKKWPYYRIYNYKKFLTDKSIIKHALISYLVDPIVLYPNTSQFSNHGIARSIPRALNELGYIVDIIYWKDETFIPQKKYDLFIAHGAINFDKIYSHLPSSCITIYFSSGNYWKFNNSQENIRLENLEKRKGVRLSNDRFISISEERVHRLAKGIITLGDPSALKPYENDNIHNVFAIPNATYPDSYNCISKRDFNIARNNFLFFSGSGNVHKGLDLLLEVFSKSNKHLYIMTNMDPDFVKLYKKEFSLPNIHQIGWVTMRSKKYYDVMKICGFIIHPSSSDGSAGSVIEAMQQGLIPIISKETRIDISKLGFYINPCTIKEIDNVIKETEKISIKELEQKSKDVIHLVEQNLSPEMFLLNFKKCIKKIVDNNIKN